MKIGIASLLTLALLSNGAKADTANAKLDFIEQMEALKAACWITSMSTYNEAFLVGRNSGHTSKKYEKALDSASQSSQSCVDANKPKGRDFYKNEVLRRAELKPALANYYGAWLGYMNWLSSPHDGLEESAEKNAYESSMNRLIAEIDAL